MKKQRYYLIVLIFYSVFLSNWAVAQQKVEQWNRFEILIKHTFKGNPYSGVKLSASFVGKDTSFVVSGFYDGDDTFRIRFMPPKIWNLDL